MNKLIPLGVGAVAGGLATIPVHRYLHSRDEVRAHAAHGHDLKSADAFLASLVSLTFVGAAAILTGTSRRPGTESTARMALGSLGMFVGLASSTLTKSESEGQAHIVSLGMLAAMASAGFALGANPRVPLGLAEGVAAGSLGLFAGMAGTETVKWLLGEGRSIRESLRHSSGEAHPQTTAPTATPASPAAPPVVR